MFYVYMQPNCFQTNVKHGHSSKSPVDDVSCTCTKSSHGYAMSLAAVGLKCITHKLRQHADRHTTRLQTLHSTFQHAQKESRLLSLTFTHVQGDAADSRA